MSKRARIHDESNKPSGDPPPSNPITDTDDIDTTSERNNWTSDNADNFHWVLSKYTWFVNGILQLEHRYLDIRDIREVESLEEEFERSGNSVSSAERDSQIIRHLEMTNASNPNKDVKRWFKLLRELQIAAGNKHSERQINTKHINTRSRWSVPFKSLNEVGYLIKNQALRGSKRASAEELRARKEPVRRTNIEKKNLAAIKALRKYVVCRYIYWDDNLNCIPSAEQLAHLPPVSSEMEDNSEPERWMRAMIRRHGKQMVNYLDVCAVNLATNYVNELVERGEVTADNASMSLASNNSLVKLYLNRMVGEIMRLSKSSSLGRGSSVAPGDKESKKQTIKASILKPTVETIATPTHASTFSNANDASKPGSYESQEYRYEDKRGAEMLGVDDAVSFNVKRSKSHTAFNAGLDTEHKKESWESAYNDGKRSSLHFPSANISSAQGSILDFASYGNMSAIAKGLFSGNDTDKAHHYDDEYFTQFINYDSQMLDMAATTKRDQQPLAEAKSVSWEKESPAPTELLDAIINLSMNSSGNNSVNIPQLNERNGLYGTDFSLPQPHELSSIGVPFDHSRHQMHPSKEAPLPMMSTGTSNSIYIKNSFTQDQHAHETNGQINSPHNISRSSSDTNTQMTESGSKSSSPYQDATTGIQGLFQSPPAPFTFKIPTNFQPDSRLGQLPTYNGGSQNSNVGTNIQSTSPYNSNQIPQMLAQSFSFSQLPPAIGSIPNHQQPLQKPQQQQQQHAYQMQVPEAVSNTSTNTSRLSTTLIYVDGVPQYIELVHDNTDVQPNPIRLPITRFANKKK